MKTNIALIGFMGVGKSAVANVLAGRLKKTRIETDLLVVQKAGKTIPQIFREEGEIAFREKEIEVIKEVAGGQNQVIACGGGVVLNKINIDRLRQTSTIVWLTATPDTIFKRIAPQADNRPLLREKKTLVDIRTLLRFRLPFYGRAADIKIATDGLDIESIATLIIERMREDGNSTGKKRS
jgi:shikimate kinase